MARKLRRTVVANGVTYAAGTPETAELAEAVSNPKAWDGESKPAPKKSAPKADGQSE